MSKRRGGRIRKKEVKEGGGREKEEKGKWKKEVGRKKEEKEEGRETEGVSWSE